MPVPKNFFLNERHELLPDGRPSRGGIKYYAEIGWADKGRRIRESIGKIKSYALASRDPLARSRHFILAAPEGVLKKRPGPKSKANELIEERVSFAGEHARVFERLGIKLLAVHDDGTATVHADATKLDQLETLSSDFERMGVRDQSRWASIAEFRVIPPEAKVDAAWLDSLQTPAEVTIELQPLLDRHESSEVIRVIDAIIRTRRGESLMSVGTDYSGRTWLLAKLSKPTVLEIAKTLSSVDSIHAPLISMPCADGGRLFTSQNQPVIAALGDMRNPRRLPCVAVVDAGVVQNHLQLEKFQWGSMIAPGCQIDPYEPHATQVASRVVFGDLPMGANVEPLRAGCSFFNVSLAAGGNAQQRKTTIRSKDVVPAMSAVIQQSRDIRVFNLSIDADTDLAEMDEQQRRNTLKLVEDLDMFAFDNDVLVVVAAGNSQPGVPPHDEYPHHWADERWLLRSWSRAFNALTCGGNTPRACLDGLTRRANAPSPFCRVGPGFADSPKPDVCATAGDCSANYHPVGGGGVLALDEAGYLSETMGTSFAAPLLAREAALTFDFLQRNHRPDGGRIFAATVKAFLAATAKPVELPPAFSKLRIRTLGRGVASCDEVRMPSAAAARSIWQGMIPSRDQIVRVQVPVPRKWLAAAASPQLRITCAADVPVHANVPDVWASRKLTLSLRANPESDGDHDGKSWPNGSSERVGAYPLFQRKFDLSQFSEFEAPTGDYWVVHLKYEDTSAGYRVGPDPDPRQRVAFVAELHDAGEKSNPQEFVQELPADFGFLSVCSLESPIAVSVPA